MFSSGLHDDAFYIADKLRETLQLKETYFIHKSHGIPRMVVDSIGDKYRIVIATPHNTILENILGRQPQRYVVVWKAGAVDGDAPLLTVDGRSINHLINEVKFAWKDK